MVALTCVLAKIAEHCHYKKGVGGEERRRADYVCDQSLQRLSIKFFLQGQVEQVQWRVELDGLSKD